MPIAASAPVKHSKRFWNIAGLFTLVFAATMLVGWQYSLSYQNQLLTQQRAKIQGRLNEIGASLTSAIHRRQSILTALAAFVELHAKDDSIHQKFEIYAAGLLADDTVVRAIQIMPINGSNLVYPASNNAAVLNRRLTDLLEDDRPSVRADVQQTIQSRRITVSDPYELRQGGKGVVARLAIFQADQLSGLATTILDLDALLDLPGIHPPAYGLQITLTDSVGQLFHGDPQTSTDHPVTYAVHLPSRHWTLAALPKSGWHADVQPTIASVRLSVFLIALLSGGLASVIARRQSVLASTVQTRTRQLDAFQEDFRVLFEQAIEGIIIEDSQGRCLQANPACCSLLGFTPHEILQIRPRDLFVLDDPSTVTAPFENLDPGQTFVGECRVRHKGGAVIDVELSARKLPGGRAQLFLRDITERKQAEARELASKSEMARMLAEAEVSRQALLSLLEDQKKTEAALRENEALLRIAGRMARLGGWIVNLKTNQVIWSEEVAAIHEAPPDYSPGVEAGMSFYAPEFREKIARVFDACAHAGIPYDEEMEIITARGHRVWARTIGEAIRDNTGRITHVQGAFQDITERKRADQERQRLLDLEHTARTAADEATQRLTQILGRISDGFGSLDRNWHYVFVNDKLAQMVGRRREDLIGHNIWTVFPEAIGSPVHHAYHQAMADQRTTELEHYYAPFKRWFLHRFYPSPEGLTVFSRDITERKQAEAALRETNEYLDNLLNYANAPIIVWDPQFNITRFNHAFESLTGRSASEVMGRSLDLLFPPALVQSTMELIKKTLDGERWETVEIAIQHRDGTVRTVLWNSATVLAPDAITPVATIAQGQDITERIKAEKEVRRLNDELEHRVRDRTLQLEAANKELEAFTYSVSHDLRAPLRAVNGYARILSQDYASTLDVSGQQVLDIIRSEALRMGQLIDDLLQFSRLGRQTLRIRHTPMTALALEVFTELRGLTPDRTVDFQLASLPDAAADPALIRQVWMNLLDNALKYTQRRDRAEITVSGSIQNHEAVYSVKDNGAGFDMKYADKLFGVFQRLHQMEEFEGNGVGLALVRRLVQRHGGRTWAEAEPDRGATFYFTLPL